LNWLRLYELQFIQQSMEAVVEAIGRGFWHEEATRMLQDRPVRARVPFIAYTPTGPEPWQFTLNDTVTEQNLLLAMVHMWVFRAERAHVFSVGTQVQHTIAAPKDLNTYLIDLLAVKLRS
jgi:hypothetical protein